MAVFMLVETIIGIRGKQLSKKELILASGQLIFRLVETVFFSPFFFQTSASFFPSSGKVFFNEIVHFGLQKRILELIIVSTSRKKVGIKEYCFHQTKIMTAVAKMKASSKRYVSITRKSCLHRQEYLKKNCNWFPIVEEMLLYKIWLHLNLHNGFH